MKRKSLYGLSTLSLLCFSAVLVGCSSDEATEGNEEANSDTDTENESEASAAEPSEFTVAMGTGGSSYIMGASDIHEDIYVKKLEEMANVDLDIELIPHENYDEHLMLLFASGDLPDLLQTRGINYAEVSPAIDAGALMPLNDLIEEYGPNLKEHVPQESWDSARVSDDGVIFGIPDENPLQNSTVTYVRQDWLDNLGLDVPTTVDEYIEMLRAFKYDDPNGTGEEDTIPMSARPNFAFGTHFFGAYDVIPSGWRYEDGQLVPNFIREGTKDALEVYKLLYEEGLIDNEFMVQTGQDWDSKIDSGSVGMFAHSIIGVTSWDQRLQENVPEGEYVVIPAPVGPSGEPGGVTNLGSTVADWVWVIPQGTENPEEIIGFLDWFYGDGYGDDFFTFGIEGENYTREDGEINYNYPETNEEAGAQYMHQGWLHFTGPRQYLTDEQFISGQPGGDKVLDSLEVGLSEGLVNDAQDMPTLPTLQSRPELDYTGLWMEFAARVVTGQQSLDEFDDFVEQWKDRGGDQLIEEATEWYESIQ
ncbi:extracellular solute-binding protein [Alteribacter aurantiacus]|uniref:extracellular solute-binding protein n=1 Tax=Alteribacter aurantiacus TaxID=254410 RepID=UPI00041047D9|nr:extracellular solute-binding protein [Alteribacter aurantiacus]